MAISMLHLCIARLRALKTVDSHAMPFALTLQTTYGCGGSSINMLAPVTFVAQGSSVSISRGGPPILDE